MTSQLRIVQLNVGSLFEPDWDERRHEIVAWLDRLEPDVVCLQETCESDTKPNTGGWISDHLAGDWHWHFGGFGFGSGILDDESVRFGSTVVSRWPITEHRLHRLPTADDGSFTARIGWELLHVVTAGVDVFSTHLAAAPTDAHHRRRQVVAIDDIIRVATEAKSPPVPFGQKRPGMPAILCGDFNAEPDSDEIRFLTSLTTFDDRSTFYQDAWRVAGDHGPGITQDWRVNPIAASLNVHRKRIDYVFVGDPFQRAGDAGRVLSARVVFDEPMTGIVASDHFGLVVDVVWPDRPAPR